MQIPCPHLNLHSGSGDRNLHLNKLGGGGGEWSSWVRELGQHLHLFVLWLFCVSAKFSNLFLCLQSPAHRRGETVSPPMGGVTGPPFLNVPPASAGPQCCKS